MDKKRILYILLAVLSLSLVYRIANVPEEKRAPLKYTTGARVTEKGAKGTIAGKEGLPKIELSKLLSKKRKPPADGVNLFNPFFVKSAPPEPAKPTPPPPPPVDPLEEELKLFRFMGFFEKSESSGRDKKIFLAKGQNVYIVKNGDTIEGKFKVNIMKGMVEVSAIDSEKRIAIPVEEK